jgi:hypothetical protein
MRNFGVYLSLDETHQADWVVLGEHVELRLGPCEITLTAGALDKLLYSARAAQTELIGRLTSQDRR